MLQCSSVMRHNQTIHNTSLLLLLTSSFSNTSTQLLNDTKCLVPENVISLNFPARDPVLVASRVLELVTASATKTGRIMNTFCGGWWLDRIRVGGHAACSDQRERHSGGGCQVRLESSMRQGDEQKSLHIVCLVSPSTCELQMRPFSAAIHCLHCPVSASRDIYVSTHVRIYTISVCIYTSNGIDIAHRQASNQSLNK